MLRLSLSPNERDSRKTPTGHAIHFMFGSRVEFSGSADQVALFPVRSNTRRRPAAILENSNLHISATGEPQINLGMMFTFKVINAERHQCLLLFCTVSAIIV